MIHPFNIAQAARTNPRPTAPKPRRGAQFPPRTAESDRAAPLSLHSVHASQTRPLALTGTNITIRHSIDARHSVRKLAIDAVFLRRSEVVTSRFSSLSNCARIVRPVVANLAPSAGRNLSSELTINRGGVNSLYEGAAVFWVAGSDSTAFRRLGLSGHLMPLFSPE